jgi:hypothetical protein
MSYGVLSESWCGELEGSDSLGQVKVDGRSLCPTPQ